MKKIYAIIFIWAFAVFGMFVLPVKAGTQIKIENVDLFWGQGCPHCAKLEPFWEKVKGEFPELQFNKYEIYYNQDNALELNRRFEEKKIQQNKRGVPAVFINGRVLIGGEVEPQLESEIGKVLGGKAVEVKGLKTAAVTKFSDIVNNIWAFIVGPAIVDSINPCAIAVLVILLGALMLNQKKKTALIGGLFFTLSVYITYFLFGLGLTHFIQVSGISIWVYRIVGILALFIGLANLKDFFWYGGGGFVMEIPRKWRPTLKSLLSRITSPLGAFLIGFVVTFFELPCTGGPYFFVIGLMSQNFTMGEIVPLLLLYNLVFVLPLLVITLLIYFGISSVEKANQWKENNIRVLHLIGGLIMLGLGIWVLVY